MRAISQVFYAGEENWDDQERVRAAPVEARGEVVPPSLAEAPAWCSSSRLMQRIKVDLPVLAAPKTNILQ